MADYVSSLLQVTGAAQDLAEFKRLHLTGGTFDFNTVIPMPPTLDIEASSSVETGYAALYGDWQKVAGYWMFKEPAHKFGFPFPLGAREHVVECLESFDCADMYLTPAKQYHQNVTLYGHGDWYGWCQEHWGTKWNADEVLIVETAQEICIRFVTAGKYPSPVLKKLSLEFPSLLFHVRYVDEFRRWCKDFVLANGKETKKIKRTPLDIEAEIQGAIQR